ncbi:hypothetical protein E9229_003461 [Paeniglutamicibacter cryotolerans]|uniref:Uncharacterized protein n=1 Tax=Paeniglutamicibacter cryotolerans TaxID=670079 RepID=A0A839QR06_9MICC|nr:hypothetical protein [Paeniglutamicibacter cryotolerans]
MAWMLERPAGLSVFQVIDASILARVSPSTVPLHVLARIWKSTSARSGDRVLSMPLPSAWMSVMKVTQWPKLLLDASSGSLASGSRHSVSISAPEGSRFSPPRACQWPAWFPVGFQEAAGGGVNIVAPGRKEPDVPPLSHGGTGARYSLEDADLFGCVRSDVPRLPGQWALRR